MKFEKMHWLGLVVGSMLLIGSMAIFRGGNLMYFLIVVSVVAGSVPFMISFLWGQNKQKEKEKMFLAFTRDLVEMVKSGTPINKSIETLKNRSYGSLTSHINKLANQLSMGITLTSALNNFAKDTKSKVISRSVGLISEAEKAGGHIETILESVSDSINQINQLREERKAAVSNLVTQGYLIFFVFIIIMLVLEFKILPLVSDLKSGEGLNVDVNNMNPNQFAMPLFVMLLVQSFFAGLVIGKIAEGSLKAGIKHSFILLALTLLVTTGVKALVG